MFPSLELHQLEPILVLAAIRCDIRSSDPGSGRECYESADH